MFSRKGDLERVYLFLGKTLIGKGDYQRVG